MKRRRFAFPLPGGKLSLGDAAMAEETEHMEAAAPPDAASDADLTPAPAGPPPPPPTAAALAGKAKDLEALRDAVVDAASVGAGLWFSYLFVLFYLLIAAGGVTHRDLFLESPVKLPFLNVDLPLLGFFVLGPVIFLIVHAYVLLHFVLLAGKAGDFDAELRAQIADEEVRSRLRRQLPSNIFVQFLAGSREVRSGVMGFMLRLIAQISLVIGPLALLVFFQLQFLPYHNEAITWWHRIAVLVDIVVLWMLWPSIARGVRTWLSGADFRRGKILALAFASLAPVLLVTTIATFPAEWLDDTLPPLKFIPLVDDKETMDDLRSQNVNPWAEHYYYGIRLWHWASLHELLVGGTVDFGTRKPKSLWSNRLVLPGFDAIDHAKFDSEAKIEAAAETISLRARNLDGAVLIGAKLMKGDFTGAPLRGAKLYDSDLRGAKFDCADIIDSPAEKPQQCANLGGALLLGARLEGASLYGAELAGAELGYVKLQGASLAYAKLQGASLGFTDLHCASLDGADLRGASLVAAQLQGASLDHADLDGASLLLADFEGASLQWASNWRVRADEAKWDKARVHISLEHSPISDTSFEKPKNRIVEQVPEGDKRRDALELIENLNPTKPSTGEEKIEEVWKALMNSSPAKEVYEKRLAELYSATGCAADEAPYVIHRLLDRWITRVSLFAVSKPFPFDVESPQLPELAKAFLNEEHCPGAHGLSNAEKAKLKEIRDRPPLPAPKQ